MIYVIATYFLFNLALLFVNNALVEEDVKIPFAVNLLMFLFGLPLLFLTLFLIAKGGK
jgi:hypothetical protein